MTTDQHCGYAAIIGLPNAGKSTLMNALVGMKLSIVTHKKQTTRQRILGIVTQDSAQIILLDTPGLFMPKKTMEKAMVKAAWDALPDGDVIVHLIDASLPDPLEHNRFIIDRLPKNRPVFLVMNKIDKVKKPKLLALSAALHEAYDYEQSFMIAAHKNYGVEDVMRALASKMPAKPWLYGEDEITDMPMRFMAAEITREKIFEQLHKELPYSIAVETEEWENFDNGSVKIRQVIYVERDSQKGIVVGKGGAQIKKLGETARKDIENTLGIQAHLKLFVKVKGDAVINITEQSGYGV